MAKTSFSLFIHKFKLLKEKPVIALAWGVPACGVRNLVIQKCLPYKRAMYNMA